MWLRWETLLNRKLNQWWRDLQNHFLTERERERQKEDGEREREREKEKETETKTERDTDSEMGRETEYHKGKFEEFRWQCLRPTNINILEIGFSGITWRSVFSPVFHSERFSCWSYERPLLRHWKAALLYCVILDDQDFWGSSHPGAGYVISTLKECPLRWLESPPDISSHVLEERTSASYLWCPYVHATHFPRIQELPTRK